MGNIKYRYSGPSFDNIDIHPEIYRDQYFEKELYMESTLFYELRKKNNIKPYRIIESTSTEKIEIKEFFNKNKHGFFFLFEKNDLIGSVLVLENYIQSLCINKKYQRQGYGEKLTKFAITYISQNKYDYVELNILDGNIAAEELYKKIGFIRVE